MRHQIAIISLCLLLVGQVAQGQPSERKPAAEKINWVSLEQADKLNREAPKKTFVDLYTYWCGWCKVMDKNTFAHPRIVSLMNKHFYAVKFNAEQREDVKLGDRVWKFNQGSGRRGTHQAALELGRTPRGMSYPTTVLLDESFNKIQAIPGYLDPHIMEKILVYFGEDYPKKGVGWPEFEQSFKGQIPPQPKPGAKH